MTNIDFIERTADSLFKAQQTVTPIVPLTEQKKDISIEDAYKIQLFNIQREVNNGKRIVGKKIGLTSKPMQELAGVNEPDYGHLLEDMEISSDKPFLESQKLYWPRVEGELAFILKEDLHGPDVTIEDVLDATDFIAPAIEIVDTRIKDWNIKIQDTVGDNGSSAFFILGKNKISPKKIDRINITMKLLKNGELINQGKGADVLGDPAFCVAWLANKLYAYNIYLKKGEIVLSGALTKALDAKKGDKFSCQFSDGAGDVYLEFI